MPDETENEQPVPQPDSIPEVSDDPTTMVPTVSDSEKTSHHEIVAPDTIQMDEHGNIINTLIVTPEGEGLAANKGKIITPTEAARLGRIVGGKKRSNS